MEEKRAKRITAKAIKKASRINFMEHALVHNECDAYLTTLLHKEKKASIVNEIFWFGLLGRNTEKLLFSELKTGLGLSAEVGLLAGKYGTGTPNIYLIKLQNTQKHKPCSVLHKIHGKY